MGARSIRLANEAWEAFFRAQATLAREFERDGAWGDLLPREYGVLYALSAASDGLRMCDLREDVLLTQAGISRLVIRLEKRGLVARSDDPDDARAQRIHLTARGADEQRRLGHAHARHVASVLTRALEPVQLDTLTELSRALLSATSAERTSS
jgi:DNA-binding MarR family transcriptional regulator